jgi:hypothetical protein
MAEGEDHWMKPGVAAAWLRRGITFGAFDGSSRMHAAVRTHNADLSLWFGRANLSRTVMSAANFIRHLSIEIKFHFSLLQ